MRLQLHHLHGAGDASDASTPIWFSSRFLCFSGFGARNGLTEAQWRQYWRIQNSKFRNSNFIFFKLHGPASILKYQKNIKLRQKQFHMKDTGKSSSRKLRRVIYYTLYRMDPQKAHYKISFFATPSKTENSICFQKNRTIFPPNSRSTAPLRRLFMFYYTLYRMDPQKTH